MAINPSAAPRPETSLTAGVSFEPPPEVARFCARAVLLYGIPFHYLVPDERMLPPESIRFFYLDPGWVATLIQGATSIGRPGDRDTVIDTTLRHRALGRAMVDAAQVREKGPACEEPKATATIGGAGNAQTTIGAASWPLTGFLLRSELMDGWQGVEMRAYDKEDVELAPLRIDRLAPDVLLCIFNGAVAKLTVKQPPEGLHFGLSPQANPRSLPDADEEIGMPNRQYQRLSLRKVTEASGGVVPGAEISDRMSPIQVPMRLPVDPKRWPTRVVRMARLAEQFAAGLQSLGHPAAKFTSAELGVQMIESAGLVEFKAPK